MILQYASKEKVIHILTLIHDEEYITQLKAEQEKLDCEYHAENNTNVVVLDVSTKFDYNSDNDSGFSSTDEDYDTKSLGETQFIKGILVTPL